MSGRMTTWAGATVIASAVGLACAQTPDTKRQVGETDAEQAQEVQSGRADPGRPGVQGTTAAERRLEQQGGYNRDPIRRGEARDRQPAERSRRGQPSTGQQQGQAPEGYVLVREEIVYLLAARPQQHLVGSLQRLAAGDRRGAAAEVRLAAAYVDLQSSRGDGEARQALSGVADQLNQLARQIAQGQDLSAEKLTREFARAEQALAEHHQVMALAALQKDNPLKAGYELEAAAQSFQQAIAWSGRPARQENTQTIGNALEVAASLRGENLSQFEQAQQQGQASAPQRQPAQASGQNQDQDAQEASGRQGSGQGLQDPRIGTSKAEAENIQEHALQVVQALGRDIEQFNSNRGQEGQQDQQQGRRGDQQQ